MGAVAFLHGHQWEPLVWRNVADNLPAHWAVIAPDFFGVARGDVNGGASRVRDGDRALPLAAAGVVIPDMGSPGAGAMAAQINWDLSQVGIDEPVLLVAEGVGAIPAIAYAAQFPERTSGVLLSGPKLRVSGSDVLKMKAAMRIRRGPDGGAGRSDAGALLDALKGADVQALAGELDVPRRVVVAEKDRGAQADGAALRDSGWEHAAVSEAERDWFSYAPAIFAAHLVQFVEDHKP